MNSIYRSIWNDKTGTFVATSEIAKSHGKKSSPGATALVQGACFALKGLAGSLMLAFASNVYALPTGGVVSAGSASIATGAGAMTINQASQNAALNWQSFSIGQTEAVSFVQPNSSSVALNRVLGADPSSILGSLSANGKVFLVNPNGMLFGKGASVNVGGLVASTLNITDGDFMAGAYKFSGAGNGAILNQGTINADGGFVALLGANISNEGVISARLGSVTLAAGNAMTLDIAGDGLLNVTVNQGAVNALVQNGGLIQADGGQVLLTAQAAGSLLQSAVNNNGVIQAQTIANHNGTIRLMGDMQSGTVNVGGTLDTSAPHGGDGGFVETSAAHVNIADNTRVTTLSAQGKSGNWLIDPADFTIAATGGNMTGTTLSSNLTGGSVSILSSAGTVGGNGDINVNAAVSWSANMLTLTAARDININAVMTASGAATLTMNTATANGSDGVVAGGAVKVGMNGDGFIGRVDFPSRNGVGILTINGLAYTIVDQLGASTTTTVTDLQGMKSGLATNYALGTNIDATATSGWNAAAGFVPIGTPGTPFMGRFDGLGHTITALTVKPGSASAGLFGATGPNLSIQNVGLVGGSVIGAAGSGGLIGTNGIGTLVSNSYNTGSVTGAAGTGGLVGDNTTGATSNSFATGNVTGASGTGGLLGTNTTGAVSNSYANGNVVGSNAGTGGLVGSNTTGAVSKSYASGSVTGAGAATGGLLGSTTAGTVTDTYATGNVIGNGAGVGGLIGTTTGTVTTSYSVGSVTTTGGGSALGALVGVAGPGTVTFSFWNSDTSALASAGGGLAMTTAQMKAQADFTSATAANGNINPNWNFINTWYMYEGITYPLLQPFMTRLTVTANSASAVYNAAAQTGGGGVTYSTTTNPVYLLGTVSTTGGGTAVGSYAITPSGLYSNQKGYMITYANGTLGITPAALGVAASGAAKTYDGLPFSGGNGVTYSGFQGGDTAASLSGALAYSGTSQGAVNAGSYTITPGGQSSPNYNITYIDGTLGVAKAALGIAANSTSKIFGNTVSFTGSEFTSTGLKQGETVGSVSLASAGAVATATVAGSPYAITASAASGGTFNPSNYTISYVDGSMGVISAGLAIAANPAVKTYDGLGFAGGNGVVYTGFQGSDTPATLTGTLTYGGSSQGAINVGSYALIPSGQTSSNYTITYVNSTLGVIAAPLGITANSASKSYGSTAAFTGSEFVSAGLMNGETVGSVSLASAGSAAAANVATYAITASDATGGTFTPANYTISYVDGALGVIPAPLGITANTATRIYGAANPDFSATYSNFQNGETPASLTGTLAFTTPAVVTSDVGRYAITPSGQSSSNYTISYFVGPLDVTPAPLVVTASNVSKAYGQTPTLTAFTTVGLANGDTVGSVTETSPGTPATASVAGSPYAITPSAATGGTFKPANYTLSYVNGLLTVTPITLTVTAGNVSKSYGQTPTLTAFSTAGLVNGETVGSVTETSPGRSATASVAGSPYAITPSAATGGTFTPSNYTVNYVNGLLTITPLGLTVTASDALKTFGQTPILTAFTTTGLINGDTVGSVTETSPGTAADASVVGSPYVITPSNATGGTFTPANYTITYVNGELTVMPLIKPVPETVPTLPPIVAPPLMPTVVLAETPAQLLTVVPAAVPERTRAIVVEPAPVVAPAPETPKIYVAPLHPRKPDRN